MEEQVPDLLRALLYAGPIIVAWWARLAAEQRLRQEQEDQARRQRVRAAEERSLREELWTQADAWERSQGLETYLTAVEARLTERYGVLGSEEPEARWLAWARRMARASDPLRSGKQEDGMRRWLALQSTHDYPEQSR